MKRCICLACLLGAFAACSAVTKDIAALGPAEVCLDALPDGGLLIHADSHHTSIFAVPIKVEPPQAK